MDGIAQPRRSTAATIAARMGDSQRKKVWLVALITALGAFALWAAASGAEAGAPGCPSFDSQAAAQTYFVDRGGGPGNAVGRLDPDGDGVACEGLGAPYQGFATIGYNRKRDFFYGVATMPPLAAGNGRFACLAGNRFDPEGPRRLGVYRLSPGGDVAVLGGHTRSAESRPDTGKLVWKADKASLLSGHYYVAFEAALRTSPYGPGPCPEFRSRPARLP